MSSGRAADYQVTADLGETPIGYIEHRMGISSTNRVAFTGLDGSGNRYARAYDLGSSTSYTLQSGAPSWAPGYTQSRAEDINASGHVVGFVESNVFQRRATAWQWNFFAYGSAINLGAYSSFSSEPEISGAYALSEGHPTLPLNRYIAGFARETESSPPRAQVWEVQAFTMAPVGPATVVPLSAGMTYNIAYGVNDAGIVVGGEGTGGTSIFAWKYNMQTSTLEAIPGVQALDGYLGSVATSVTDNFVVGYTISATLQSEAFVHDLGTGSTTTGLMIGPDGGSRGPAAIAMAAAEEGTPAYPHVFGLSQVDGVASSGDGLVYVHRGANGQECSIDAASNYSGNIRHILGAQSPTRLVGWGLDGGSVRALVVDEVSAPGLAVESFVRDPGNGDPDFHWYRVTDSTPDGAGSEVVVLVSNAPGCGIAYPTCSSTADLSTEGVQESDFDMLSPEDFAAGLANTDPQPGGTPAYSYVQALANVLGGCEVTAITETNTATVNPAGIDPADWTIRGNWNDCDSNGANGAESDIWHHLDHCGACNSPCPGAPGTVVCDMGSCVSACPADYADCENGSVDGCESHLPTDIEDCGACGVFCSTNNSNPTCTAGVCSVGCIDDYRDCDMDEATGCEIDTATNPDHCGGCGSPCAFPNTIETCTGGSCGWTECEPGWWDINSNFADGCEYYCGGSSAAADRPDVDTTLGLPGADTNCDGIDGDISKSVFVSKGGADTPTCGTISSPCLTITQGLIRAQATSSNDVLIGAGTYFEAPTIPAGIGLHGGYGASSFYTRSADPGLVVINGSALLGADRYSLRVVNASLYTPISYLSVLAPDAGGNGVTSYALAAYASSGLRVHHTVLAAGNGSAGSNGARGANGASGHFGWNGGPGTCDDAGGAGGDGGTGWSNGLAGGDGGDGGGQCQCSGADGVDGPGGGGVGGDGGNSAGSCGHNDGQSGTDATLVGANGSNGCAGIGTSVDPFLGFWDADDGCDGTAGFGGGGGGGGGGGSGQGGTWCDDGGGNGGGGGAEGGGGGFGGNAGGGGGGSFAVFAYNSSGMELWDNLLKSRNAGNGGNGGAGGAQGSGGSGGSGATACDDEIGKGGGGGDGADGGSGGAAGGGRGGDSVCLGLAAGFSVLYYGNTCVTGRAGNGGFSLGNDGSNGVVASTMNY